MKLIRYGRLIQSFSTAAIFCAALLSAGCAHNSSKRDFAAVSAHLERGGTVYGIFTRNASLLDGMKNCFEQFEQIISSAKYTEAEKNAARQRIAGVQAAWHLAGFHNINGLGISSVLKSGGIFSNRIFLSADPGSDGALNRLVCRENKDVSILFERLPRETFLAAGINVSGNNILTLLNESGSAGEKILRGLPPGFPVEVFASVEGWLIFAIARNALLPPSENCIMLQIPDPEGKLFALAAVMIRRGQAVPMETRIVLPLVDETICLDDPVVKKADGKLFIYSSAKAEELFEKRSNGTLLKHPEFLRYAKNIRLNGSAFTYNRKLAVPGRAFVSEIPFAGVLIPLEECGNFGVLSCHKNGWLWQENSDSDLSGAAGDAGLYRLIGKMILPQKKNSTPGKTAAVNRTIPRPAGDHCPKALKKLYADLLKYAEQNQNKFPEFAGIKSLKQIFPKFRNPAGGKIFYFGAPARQANHPLAISCHRKLSDSFCVLYADGTVRTYKLERAGSCRRIISFLYTVHRWEAKLFQHLIRQAQQLDEESAKKE